MPGGESLPLLLSQDSWWERDLESRPAAVGTARMVFTEAARGCWGEGCANRLREDPPPWRAYGLIGTKETFAEGERGQRAAKCFSQGHLWQGGLGGGGTLPDPVTGASRWAWGHLPPRQPGDTAGGEQPLAEGGLGRCSVSRRHV